MTDSSSVTTEGAEIHYDVDGEGPLLLVIAGAGGDGARYEALTVDLARDYRVVRYDRRCCGRSTGDRDRALDMTQQARDAAAVIEAVKGAPALVVGNSGGANVALQLAADRPELVDKVLAHEPPALPVLPDADAWIAFSDKVEEACRDKGLMPAMMAFLSAVKGISGPPPGPAPNPRNLQFFMEQELHNICRFAPDMDRLAVLGGRLKLASGSASADAYYARTAPIIAERTGAQLVEFAGHHFSFADEPARFAADIRAAFAG